VVSADFIFFGLTATCIFVFRKRRDPNGVESETHSTRVPGHPVTTLLFVAASWLVVINTVYKYPKNTATGLGIIAAGIPAYFFWRWRNRR
jgi:APA family basic amino acid/polyamine antiporter